MYSMLVSHYLQLNMDVVLVHLVNFSVTLFHQLVQPPLKLSMLVVNFGKEFCRSLVWCIAFCLVESGLYQLCFFPSQFLC